MKSFFGGQYVLSIVDDASRDVWIYLMKKKSEASQLLKDFCYITNT